MLRMIIAINCLIFSFSSHSLPSLDLDIFHSCKSQTDQKLFCWGYDEDTGGNAIDTPDTLGYEKYQLGENFGCMLKDQSVSCWGSNFDGQTVVPELSEVTDIAVGSKHACAMHSSNRITCWGGGDDISLLDVPTLYNPSFIVSDFNHTCAIDGDEVKCWGNDGYGQAADITLSQPEKVVTGINTTCAIDEVSLTCWGRYDHHIVGKILDVGLGYNHGCALVEDNGQRTIECWGDNRYGQLDIPIHNNPDQLTVGRSHNCFVENDSVSCWGRKVGWEKSEASYSFSNITFIASGNDHSCAKSDQGIQCWGRNNKGQADNPDRDGDGVTDIDDEFPNNQFRVKDLNENNIDDLVEARYRLLFEERKSEICNLFYDIVTEYQKDYIDGSRNLLNEYKYCGITLTDDFEIYIDEIALQRLYSGWLEANASLKISLCTLKNEPYHEGVVSLQNVSDFNNHVWYCSGNFFDMNEGTTYTNTIIQYASNDFLFPIKFLNEDGDRYAGGLLQLSLTEFLWEQMLSDLHAERNKIINCRSSTYADGKIGCD